MSKRIFRSIFLVALVVLLAGLAIATNMLYTYFNDTQVKRLNAELRLVADTVNEVGVEYFDNFNSTVFRFTVVAADGSVRYDTQAEPSEMENHAEREEIAEALRDGRGSSARSSSTLMQKTFYEAILLDSGDVLRISASQWSRGALLLSMLPAILVIVCCAALLAFILSRAVAKKLVQPLLRLDLEHPMDAADYAELRPILSKLHEQMNSLRRKNDEFEQLISAMNEGLVLLDEHGMVLSMNASARRIFNAAKAESGSDFLLLDRSADVGKAIWSALDGKRSEFTEQRDGAEYQFTVSPIESGGKCLGVLLLAFDISDRAFAERNRREFTANVSHELKTPLQSIIGSAELLESGLVRQEDSGRFVSTIRKEAARLLALINDIIRLSRLDEGDRPATEGVDLSQVIAEVVDVLRDSAEKKGVRLCVEDERVTLYGVRRYLYELIYNLCDNAIRYNVEGGSVTISLRRERQSAVLRVADTGIGIAPEHHGRIFERFYRVDKSHSRETGGTGLGLSIVKHTAAYHNATITLESHPDQGTTIEVRFPCHG